MLTLLPLVAVQVRLASFQGPHSGGNSHLRKIQKFTNEHRIFLSTFALQFVSSAFFAHVFLIM